ncbi:DUF4232 domain-containing protein [Streptomyces sp. NPDC056773]|uniref:DUF4232 domain-containing protein n=1 Tax=unclassified Streptomyces TaxID=2593676 RepID=UPI00367F34BC
MNTAVRTGRRGWKTYLLGAATVTALLASAACSPSGDEGGPSGAPTSPGTATSPASPSPTASPATPKPGDTASAKPTPGASAPGGGGDAVALCATGEVSITATSADAPGEVVRHILLTVKNTSQKTCAVYHYPQVQLGGARGLVPVIKDSAPTPGTPYATLEPGKEAYAALLLSGPMDEAQARTMTVQLQDRKAGSKAGEPVKVALPGGTVYYNDFVKVTHWMTASGLALRFIMSS